ncbi:AMP-binding protein [Polaromonas sp. JS666]|jgi:acyl-CoA synthetase (AMP-forming)/AMP-acid ligase II|uniref:AMP-binding protein n=1 Tax=Polaromonas sp. (strain JS666 / ATCC BAA-500) TaxID=296591 RepID=UPI0000537CD8|nr:AMP-binding protein [Polaromonas sp. JS666]ABE47117.1 AMP-dependent synthetase and ligase [Polaromonas sp. JS666]
MSLRSFTLHDLINRNAGLHGSNTALVFGDQRVTHAQYAERTARLAAGLAAAGVGRGDRLAILAQNGLEYVDLFGAAAHLGAIVVPINWRLSAEEVAYVIEDVAPRVLIVADEFKALLPQHGLDGMQRYTLGTAPGAAQAPWQPVSALYLDRTVPPADLNDDEGLVIIHTAAVGGRPRGALLSHRNLIAASLQTQLAWRLTPADINLGVLPLFHVAAIGFLLATQQAGGATLLLTRFDPPSLVKHIDEDGGSLIGTFPPMLGALLDAAAAQGSALDSLRVVSGIDVPETIARLRTDYPQATFWSAYGQTETSGSISLAPFDERPGSAGRPAALNTVAVVDELDRPLPTGATGEIVVRGPMVFQGYWRCDADNAFTLRNGWHHTGDMGRIDAEGYLWYSGRSPAKELIKPGGENVYPAEVERALLEHPALAQAVVIGVPDVQWGEAVKAVCVLNAGHTLSAEELIEFVGGRIARYKKPKHVVFVAALPRTAVGGVDRAAVKAGHGQA